MMAGSAAMGGRLRAAGMGRSVAGNPKGRLATTAERGIAPGPFAATWESLKEQYRTPEWYRDVKFGIWAHWTAQCVPEQGDWYARRMYIQGDPAYEYHVKTYGHPSKVGFKDIDVLWKAEHWQPEELLDLYQAAGARYFMTLANHHDNFDNFNSKYHAWNSTRIGPKKDIVGTWVAACRRRGMKVGVSNHSAHAWHWFQPAFAYDAEGPLAGVRYDGFTRASAGRGTAWDGLDPRELYVGPSLVAPDGIRSIQAMDAWHDKNDRVWDENPPCEDPEFTNTWFLRFKDLIDQHGPDLVYFDDTELPLGQAGLDATAHYYNSNMQRHGGKLEAVVFGKVFVPQHRGAATLDLERGRSNEIQAQPFQTDTCLGDWHYSRKIFEEHRYKTAKTVIELLVDCVSKNGNLCLSVPLKGDGTIDSDERKVLTDLAAWMPVQGEGIFGSRPFAVYGEGPPEKLTTGNFNESKGRAYTAEDIRFTTKGEALYAYVLGWPADGKVRIKTLGGGSQYAPGEIAKVEMLGVGSVPFERNGDGLVVNLGRARAQERAFGLKVMGSGIVA
jgi:alpha-L-fucosidase